MQQRKYLAGYSITHIIFFMDFLTSARPPLAFPSFREEIARRVSAGDTSSFIYILPTGAWARQEISRVVEIASPRAIAVPHIYSMQEFVGKLHAKLQPFKRVVSTGESAILVELAIRELFKDDTLRYYQEREGRALPLPQGTFEELVAAIATLKERGITTTMLADDIVRKEKNIQGALESTDLRRARDLYSIYKRYEEKLGTHLIDEYGQHLRLTDEFGLAEGMKPSADFTGLFRRVFPEVKDIFVEVFIRMADPARYIVNGCRYSSSIYFAVDKHSSNPDLFALQQTFIEKQQSEGFQLIVSVEKNAGHPFTQALRKDLFSRIGKKSAGIFDGSLFIETSTSATSRKELERVATKIKLLLLGGVSSPEKICVAMYKQDGLASLAGQVFEEYGIPVNSTERRTLATAPIFVALDSLFRLAEFKLRVSEVLRLLHSPYFDIRHSSGDPIDAQNLIEVIREFRLTSGSRMWSEEMSGHLERLKALQEFDDEFDERSQARSILRLERGIKDIILIEDVIRRFRQELRPADLFALIKNVLKDFSLKERLLHSPDPLIAVNALELDTRSYAALMETLEEVESLIHALGIASTEHPVEYYGERIRTAALKKRFAARAEPGSGVMVTSFDQTAGYDFEHLFLIGLNDDSLPTIHSPSVTTPGEYQLSEDEHLISERFAFYQLLTRARGKLYLSWQSAGSGGKSEKLPSVFVDALERIVSFKKVEEDPDANVILSSREFARTTALNGQMILPESAEIANRDKDWLQHILGGASVASQKRTEGAISDFNGYIDPDTLPPELAERFRTMRERTYSVSQLESYARCPFQFFSHYLMDLAQAPEVEIEEGMESSERGILLHRQLQKMLTSISEEGKNFRLLSADEFKSYDPYRGEKLDDLLSKPGARHPFWRIDLDTLYDPPEGRKGVLDKFLEAEQRNDLIKTHPVLFEQGFENQVVTEQSGDEPGRSFKIRGKIDRIDIDSDNTFYTVTDYKTSKGASKKEIENGLSLQLPLYLRIAEDILRLYIGSELEGVGAFYHKLTGKEAGKEPALLIRDYAAKTYVEISKSKKKGIAESPEELQSIIETTIRYANDYIDGMTRGEFPLVREDGTSACTYCDYKRACRIYEAKENGTLRKA
jgi:ATP-dependent helicase/nuclease subunit B